MGYLESAVVVYLREVYYPSGFAFPIHPMTGKIAVTEIVREIATLLMLLSVGFLAGRNFRQRFAWFIYCFAVWDIFYYVFLRVLIHWPESFFTWDILFLIPVTWTGPVIAPIIVSVTMILLACIILHSEEKARMTKGGRLSRTLLIIGAILVFVSFTWDFAAYMLNQYPVSVMFRADNISIAMQQYIPRNFNWWFFIAGELIILAGIYVVYSKSVKSLEK